MAAYGRDNRVPPIGAYGPHGAEAPSGDGGIGTGAEEIRGGEAACAAGEGPGGAGPAEAGAGMGIGPEEDGTGMDTCPEEDGALEGMMPMDDWPGDGMDFARLAESYQKAEAYQKAHEAEAGPGPRGAGQERQENRGCPAAGGGIESPQGASGLPALFPGPLPVLCAALAMAALWALSEGAVALAGRAFPDIISIAGPVMCATATIVSLRTYMDWPCGRDSAVLVLSAICSAALLSPRTGSYLYPKYAGWAVAAAMAAYLAADWMDRAGISTTGIILALPVPVMGIAVLARRASSFFCGSGTPAIDLFMVLGISALSIVFSVWGRIRGRMPGIALSALAALFVFIGSLGWTAILLFAASISLVWAITQFSDPAMIVMELIEPATGLLACLMLATLWQLLKKFCTRPLLRIALAVAIVFFCYGKGSTV